MSDVVTTLASLGADLALGVTVILALGALAAWRAKQPLHEQRILETTMVAALLWWPIALTPMARWTPAPVSTSAVGEPAARVAAPLARPVVERPTVALPVAAPARATSAPAVASPPASAPLDVAPLAARVYLAGVAASLLLIALGAWRLVTSVARARPAPPELVALLEDELRRLSRAHASPRLLVAADDRHAPYCTGVVRSVVVVPPRVAARPEVELRAVLRHELAHVTRGDVARRWLALLCTTLLWCHPLMWWIRARHALAVELVADEHAAGRRRRARLDYARALLAVAEMPAGAPGPLGANSIFDSPSSFTRRMTMLLDPRSTAPTRCSTTRRVVQTACAGLALVAMGGFLGATPAAQDAVAVLTAPVADQVAPDDGDTLAELRAERARLRAELSALRAALGAPTPTADAAPPAPATPRTVQRAAPLPDYTTAVVRKGDTLASILERHELPTELADEVARFNSVDRTRLAVGRKLLLPAAAPDAPSQMQFPAAQAPAVPDVASSPFPAQAAAPAPLAEPAPVAPAAPSAPAPTSAVLEPATLDMVVRLIELEATQPLPDGFESEREIVTRQRTIEVLRRALAGELRATERELAGMTERERAGFAPRDDVTRERLTTRLEILASVVGD